MINTIYNSGTNETTILPDTKENDARIPEIALKALFEKDSVSLVKPNFTPSIIIDLTEEDIILAETFQNLIKQNFNLNIPYFIATWNNSCKRVFGDAPTHLSNFYKYENQKDPRSQEPITSFEIYKASPGKKEFTYFCNEKTLKNNLGDYQSHRSKYINACQSSSTTYRGQNRFYMASYYIDKARAVGEGRAVGDGEERLHYMEKAYTWLKLAMDDKYIGATLEYIEWLWVGNAVVPRAQVSALNEMSKVAHSLEMKSKDEFALIQGYLEMLNCFEAEAKIEEEMQFCRVLLERKPR